MLRSVKHVLTFTNKNQSIMARFGLAPARSFHETRWHCLYVEADLETTSARLLPCILLITLSSKLVSQTVNPGGCPLQNTEGLPPGTKWLDHLRELSHAVCALTEIDSESQRPQKDRSSDAGSYKHSPRAHTRNTAQIETASGKQRSIECYCPVLHSGSRKSTLHVHTQIAFDGKAIW